MVDVTDETEPLCYLQGPDWRDARQSSIIENKKRSLLVSSESRGRWGDLFGFGMGWWIKKKPLRRCSSLSWLHVGWYCSSSSQTFKAFVRVVDEDPVLVFQVNLCLIGYLCVCRRKAVLKTTHFKAMAWNMKCDKEVKPGSVLVGVRMSESGNSSKCEVSSMLFISMGMAAGLSLNNRKITWSCTVYNNQVHYSWTA